MVQERAAREAEEMLVNQGVAAIEELVGGMNSGMKTKQTELQLMVGSRYHELLESADHIVAMRDHVVHVAKSLHNLGDDVASICARLQERHQKSLAAMLEVDGNAAAAEEPQPEFVTALGCPPAIGAAELVGGGGDALAWDLMDAQRFVAAALGAAARRRLRVLGPVIAQVPIPTRTLTRTRTRTLP
uniref:Uncharacterized protein n=2 Tax=Phaeomonas parva TaxID=124430 RepID=A0A7S1UF68_9STRA|mmetsp:Transcript_45476/g.142452  ORF Transcript_45476/g.142452 Transcript_45476/m.142452 type:complete len:187 (+) Transcript_45476:51-611(+)